jgi:hypothetical protein
VSAVVFLDLDGVCNDDAHYSAAVAGCRTHAEAIVAALARGLDPVRVARVERVCAAVGASVVIISGWRRYATTEQIGASLAAAGLTAPVVGAVGGLRYSGETRAQATQEWLRAHPEVTAWVVLDDDERQHWRWAGGAAAWWAGRIVHPVDGITEADADAAAAILRGAT